MPVFTANIAFLFADRPFLDRINAAKSAGFDRVECHFPYDHPIDELRQRLSRAEVKLTGLNTAPGDPARPEWGLAGLPGRETDFQRHFKQAAEYASALGASLIHVMAGVVPHSGRVQALDTYASNLRWAARLAADRGLTLLLEPLNSRDRPDYLVSRSDDIASIIAAIGEPNVKLRFDVYHVQIMDGELVRRIERHRQIIGEVGAPNVKLLFDVYHVQIMEGDLITRLERHRDVTGHVQVAGVPDRAEPDEQNEVNYRAILEKLDGLGYYGLVGLEYKPRGRTEDGLRRLDFLRG